MITHDDFAKLDIRIGTIEKIEKVENADKLLKLAISVGDETRQVISGIAEFYPDPQELVGRQVPVLLNLEPREIRGHISQGMILAIDDDGGIILLHPEKPIKNGAKVR